MGEVSWDPKRRRSWASYSIQSIQGGGDGQVTQAQAMKATQRIGKKAYILIQYFQG